MMLRQAARRLNMGRSADGRSRPAPYLGWVTKKNISEMDPRMALVLRNWYPKPSSVVLRGGCANHATGFASRVKTLAVYANSSTVKMFACTDSGVYDASSAGAIGAAAVALTSGKVYSTNMGTSANQYLILCNGVDKPKYYDGAAWVSVDGVSVPALTGVTTTGLVFPVVYKRRLMFLENGKLGFWYLAGDAVGGALTYFTMAPLCNKGGYAMAAAAWTIDGGTGSDDFFVTITSEGELLVWSGSDPGSATDWQLKGVYFIGKPVGRKCFVKLGGDLAVITESGVQVLSKVLQSIATNTTSAITNNIQEAFQTAIASYKGNYGWEGIVYPIEGALIFNIPVAESSSHKQYVMNVNTGAWCEFDSWDAEAFAVFNGALYFGSATTVVKAWTGVSDYGNNIVADAYTAPDYFDARGFTKTWNLVRPVLQADGTVEPLLRLNVDFERVSPIGSGTLGASGATWDSAIWDSAFWAFDQAPIGEWRTPAARAGFVASTVLRVATKTLTVSWLSTDFIYSKGRGI